MDLKTIKMLHNFWIPKLNTFLKNKQTVLILLNNDNYIIGKIVLSEYMDGYDFLIVGEDGKEWCIPFTGVREILKYTKKVEVK